MNFSKRRKGSTKPTAEISELKLRAQLRLAENALRQVLCAAFGEGRPADRVLSGYFRENRQCGSRDRQFISEVVFAVFRNWGILRKMLTDERREAIESGAAGPASRELEMFLFGAVYLERLQFPAADMMASGVFGVKWPQCGSADLLERSRALFAAYGCEAEPAMSDLLPEWVSGMVAADFPLADYVADLQRRPPMWLRLQSEDLHGVTEKLAMAGLPLEFHGRQPRAVAVRDCRVNLFTLDAFRDGLFEVQDLASQAIGLAAAPRSGERWWDACAGAGGKSLQLADLMQRKGTVVASDIRAYKLEDLRKRARRAGFPNIMTRDWDGKALRPKQREKFDGVLVDAPCSCSGVWRRNPDGRWTARSEEVAETAALQRTILENAADGVRPGGVLIYATCSIFTAENQQVVEAFLAGHPEFSLEAFAHPLSGETVAGGMLQLKPGDGDCDAMFVARMRRQGAAVIKEA